MRRKKLAEGKESKGTAGGINRESEGFWVGDGAKASPPEQSAEMPLQYADREGGHWSSRNSELIKSLQDRDGRPNRHSLTDAFTHSFKTPAPSNPPCCIGLDAHRLPP